MEISKEVRKWYHVDLTQEDSADLTVLISRARDKARRSREIFTDFDWAHVVQDFLKDRGYSFSKLAKTKEGNQMNGDRVRMSARSFESRSLLAEIEELEEQITAADDADIEKEADSAAKEEKSIVKESTGQEVKDQGDQNAKSNKNWPTNASEDEDDSEDDKEEVVEASEKGETDQNERAMKNWPTTASNRRIAERLVTLAEMLVEE